MGFNFSLDGTFPSFEQLAREASASIQQECITVNKKEVKGVIKRAELEKGLYLIYWNLQVFKDFTLSNTNNSSNPHYCISYFFNPEFDQIESGDKVFTCKRFKPCTLVEFNNKWVKLRYKNGSRIELVNVLFTAEWLEKQTGDPSGSGLHLILEQPAPHQVLHTTVAEQLLSMRMVQEFNNGACLLVLKAHAYNLIDAFVRKNMVARPIAVRRNKHEEVMVQVEQRIQNSLRTELPAIDQLAEEFLMSTTTLKRQFRQHYHMGIYEYYLKQKMQLGKQMLEDCKLTVTDTAYGLGYESVSHFIGQFKKHFGCSPSSVIKAAKASQNETTTEIG